MSCPCFSVTSPKHIQVSPTFFVNYLQFFYQSLHLLVVNYFRLHNVIGFVGSHGINTQLIAQDNEFNKGKIGLLQGAGTRFATWFYAMHRALHQKSALNATIHNPSFASLSKHDCMATAVNDMEDEVFWKEIIVCKL